MNDKELQNKILELENYVKNAKENIEKCEKAIKALKDIAWDRQSKKESSQMYKVLNDEKSHTSVKSNVGQIKVDKEFMEKEVKKHLDNPKLRGMVTTEELLSFPKVAKNVEAEFNPQQRGFDWQAKANDGNIIKYGERDFGEGHRLLTIHSKTNENERTEPDGQGSLRRQFYNPNFHNSVSSSITQTKPQSQENSKEAQLAKLIAETKQASTKIGKNTPNKSLDKGFEK
ncbi:hypothetical protein CQA38_08565 [Campylobacter sp. MIT 12-5580]|uniref:hypothetical protein n=1 Tax=Campylobacter sp. MIT 12-5580 TaxID=2040651 RepID=UPI0010F91427|nr:hypothetical protein [Campylobacter sp. MIT 12-5580]TKX28288.1 hypothetical protein CQA38_08565 [Campylobacter sp. MIT 12-5580]